MRKSNKKIWLIIILLLVMSLNPIHVSALDYVIDKYDINIIVNENNTYDITETITANFYVPKHGIYRTIPLSNNIIRLDGTNSNNKAKITNIKVDNKYTISKENSNLIIKIGSKNKTLTGLQTYVINYTYDIGKDPLKDRDEFYYNIIGNKWDTSINNVTFSITMPKEFDFTKLGFSSGTNGSTNSSNVLYTVDGNIITGQTKYELQERESLTVRCELPEEYFNNEKIHITYTIFVSLISLCGIIYSIILWYKKGKDDLVVETVEFYPPEDLNPCEMQFLYDGESTNDGVISLLLYLANNGYLKISDGNKKDEFIITKLKDYDGTNKIEKKFFEGLFKNSKSVVESKDLKNKFYKTINSIKSSVETKYTNKAFVNNDKESTKIMKIIFVILFITFFKVILDYTVVLNIEYILYTFCLVLGVGFVTIMLSVIPFGIKKIDLSFLVVILVIMGLIVLPIYIFIISAAKEGLIDNIRIVDLNISFISVFIIIFIGILMKKRTEYGNKILGKIKGFKKYLETAEKNQLEKMVEKNPEYFYNILPYTYALKISDKWIEKFKSIALEKPSWYDNNNDFNISSFGSFMNTTMKSAKVTMSSSPSSGGSTGGSTGGGSSGGGSGGGGGGSW